MQSISNSCAQNSYSWSRTQRKYRISKRCVQNVLQKQECAGNYSEFTKGRLQSLQNILADKGDACRTGATVKLSNYYKSLDLPQVIAEQSEQHFSWGCVFKASSSGVSYLPSWTTPEIPNSPKSVITTLLVSWKTFFDFKSLWTMPLACR